MSPEGPGTESRQVRRWPSGLTEADDVVVEAPLEVRVEGKAVAVTMRTPGHDLDLAAGFLLTEGVIDGIDDLSALRHVGIPGEPDNLVDCVLAGGVEAHRAALEQATRAHFTSSSCGLCGKASIDRLRVRLPALTRQLLLSDALIAALPERLRAQQPAFARTGGIHAAALFFEDGTLDVVREDIGRHNAVDKVLGHRLRDDRLLVDDVVLVVSSRAGFEIVQKARVAGVSAIVAAGAASSLAIDLAQETGVALFGFARSGRFNRYA